MTIAASSASSESESRQLVSAVAMALLARGERLAVAESCTGGLVAQLLTERPGSSAWFERGLVTYSNESKADLLGVPAETATTYGSVSGPTVLAMAEGLLQRAPVQWTLAVSGIAGPDGGTAEKPVGTVWIAWAARGIAPSASRHRFDGDRQQVRQQAALAALQGLVALVQPLVDQD